MKMAQDVQFRPDGKGNNAAREAAKHRPSNDLKNAQSSFQNAHGKLTSIHSGNKHHKGGLKESVDKGER
jgi:hypothetical protein